MKAQVKLAGKTLERNLKLNKKGFIADTAVEQAEERLEVLKAQINLANEEIKLKESQLENDSRLAQAMVDRARANLEVEDIQLSYATITAPIDGIVMDGPANKQHIEDAYEAATADVSPEVWQAFKTEFDVGLET